MSEHTLRFALFGNVYQAPVPATVGQVVGGLRRRGARVAVDRAYYDFLLSAGCADLSGVDVFDGTDFEADFAVSMGGDGTLLRTAGRVGSRQVPIVGINMGRLGFLADVSSDEVESALDDICRGEYTIDSRAVLQVTLPGGGRLSEAFALNDVAVLKTDTAAMITIRASIDGEYLATYQADGLIVSTPTGSTAYSLSNGGPIIVPRTGVMLLTAVAPHSLNIRPIVIPDTSEVELMVESRSHTFLVSVDGSNEALPEGTTLRLQRAGYDVKIVKRRTTRYFSTLRQKMMWGADSRD